MCLLPPYNKEPLFLMIYLQFPLRNSQPLVYEPIPENFQASRLTAFLLAKLLLDSEINLPILILH